MKVAVFDGDLLIGHSALTNLDWGMCVATGTFTATENYRRAQHANVIDGNYIADRGTKFRVVSEVNGEIECEVAAILDFPSLGEAELHLVGIYRPEYNILFKGHPDFPGEEQIVRNEAALASLRARDIRAWLWLLAVLAGIVLLVIWIVQTRFPPTAIVSSESHVFQMGIALLVTVIFVALIGVLWWLPHKAYWFVIAGGFLLLQLMIWWGAKDLGIGVPWNPDRWLLTANSDPLWFKMILVLLFYGPWHSSGGRFGGLGANIRLPREIGVAD